MCTVVLITDHRVGSIFASVALEGLPWIKPLHAFNVATSTPVPWTAACYHEVIMQTWHYPLLLLNPLRSARGVSKSKTMIFHNTPTHRWWGTWASERESKTGVSLAASHGHAPHRETAQYERDPQHKSIEARHLLVLEQQLLVRGEFVNVYHRPSQVWTHFLFLKRQHIMIKEKQTLSNHYQHRGFVVLGDASAPTEHVRETQSLREKKTIAKEMCDLQIENVNKQSIANVLGSNIQTVKQWWGRLLSCSKRMNIPATHTSFENSSWTLSFGHQTTTSRDPASTSANNKTH